MKSRIWSISILTLLLAFVSAGALAGNYGHAIIDAPSGKLHMREEPSSNSDSMGIFFTGVEVELKEEEENGWIEVKIGRESGYMSARYLKKGAAGDRVKEKFWTGTVRANKYARMRAGPSTEYQFYRNVNDGENVTIMGQTDEGWYYVEYKGDQGFIAGNLIYTRGTVSGNVDDGDEYVYEDVYENYRPVVTPAPAYSWQQAYRSYILSNTDGADTFALIYVNGDDVPELVIDSGVEAEGCRILTYGDGQVNVLSTRRLGFTYIERCNRLCNSDGSMDQYFDDVYEIRNGRWVCVARGEYFGYKSGWSDVIQRYICRYYIWNEQQTTIDQYLINLSAVFDSQRAVGVEDGYSRSDILNQLSGRVY